MKKILGPLPARHNISILDTTDQQQSTRTLKNSHQYSIQLPQVPQVISSRKIYLKKNMSQPTQFLSKKSLPDLKKDLKQFTNEQVTFDLRKSPSKKGNQFKLKQTQDRTIILKRRNAPYISYDDSKEALIEKLNHFRDSLPVHLQNQDFDKCIELNKELIKISIQLKNVTLFSMAIELLGDFSISNNEFNNAIYFYNQLRIISDFTDNIRMKVKSLIELAQTCKTLQFFHYSRIFLKKALQYAWLQEYHEVEVQIYDKMGLLYYLQGDIKKAQHFHERSMNYLVEQNDSQVKRHALETIKKYQKSIIYKTTQVNRMMLAKLGMLGSRYEDESETEVEQLNQIKLSSQVDFKVQLQQIMGEEEFTIEIGTPSNANKQITMNGVIQDEELQKYSEDVIHLHNIMKKKVFSSQQFQLSHSNNRNTELYKQLAHVDESLLKQDMNEQIKKRLKVNSTQKKSIEQYKKYLTKFHCFLNLGDPQKNIMLNHLSPNRNAEGFNHYFKPVKNKVKKLLDVFYLTIINNQQL